MIGQLPDTTHHRCAFEICNRADSSTFGFPHYATPRYEAGVFKAGDFKMGKFKTGYSENLGHSELKIRLSSKKRHGVESAEFIF